MVSVKTFFRQDVGRLFVPSVQTLAKISERPFRVFVESVNEAWDRSYRLTDLQPQPDYAVGLGRSALSEARIKKLQPLFRMIQHFAQFLCQPTTCTSHFSPPK